MHAAVIHKLRLIENRHFEYGRGNGQLPSIAFVEDDLNVCICPLIFLKDDLILADIDRFFPLIVHRDQTDLFEEITELGIAERNCRAQRVLRLIDLDGLARVDGLGVPDADLHRRLRHLVDVRPLRKVLDELVVLDAEILLRLIEFKHCRKRRAVRSHIFEVAICRDAETVLHAEDVHKVGIDVLLLIGSVVSILAVGPDDMCDLIGIDDDGDLSRGAHVVRELVVFIRNGEGRRDCDLALTYVGRGARELHMEIGRHVLDARLMFLPVVGKVQLALGKAEIDAVDDVLRDLPLRNTDLKIADAVAVAAVRSRIDLHAQPVIPRIRAFKRGERVGVISRLFVLLRCPCKGDIVILRLVRKRRIGEDQKVLTPDHFLSRGSKPIGELGAEGNGDARVLAGIVVLPLELEGNVVLKRVGGEVDLNALTLVARDRRALLPAVVIGILQFKVEIELRRPFGFDFDRDLAREAAFIGFAFDRKALGQGLRIHRHQRVNKADGGVCTLMRYAVDRDVVLLPVDIDRALADLDGAVRREARKVLRCFNENLHIVGANIRFAAEEGTMVSYLIAVFVAAFGLRARLVVLDMHLAERRHKLSARSVARKGIRPIERGVFFGVAVRPGGLLVGAAVRCRHARGPLVRRLRDSDRKAARDRFKVLRRHGVVDRVLACIREEGEAVVTDLKIPGICDIP